MVAGGHANGGATAATTPGGGADKVRGEVVGEEEKISGRMTGPRGLGLISSAAKRGEARWSNGDRSGARLGRLSRGLGRPRRSELG